MRRSVKRQAGVAIITALLLTTLAVTIVASLFWQQQVQVRSMENQRLHLQTQWILRGALDLARLILRQDASDHQTTTSLDDPWATPVEETRLDQYVERERTNDESYDATLSGSISDAQSRYNLANLAKDRVPQPAQIKVFERLLSIARLDPSLAKRTAQVMAEAQSGPFGAAQTQGAQPTTLEITQLDDLLAVQGFNIDAVNRLREWCVVLPRMTPVNVNTAGPEVLAAVMSVSPSQSAVWVERRKKAYWRTSATFLTETDQQAPDQVELSVHSKFFLVKSRIRLERASLTADSLIEREGPEKGFATTVLWSRLN